MSKYAVVVVGYNRVGGMLRLLESLEKAQYGEDKLTLIISLDNCGNSGPEEAAKSFVWSHGEKIVRTFPKRQGLRKHILSCGEYLKEYDAIAVLEDDLLVSPAYYQFMKQAVEFYKDRKEIAGISLYSHKMNVNVDLPFMPEPSGQDVFFMQFAQSWGQVWMKEQWQEFRHWYEEHKEEPVAGAKVPEFVSGWPKTSWLKYHIKYCIDQNKYFVYPYDSMTTCFSDAGEHSKETNTVYQVPMAGSPKKTYCFGNLESDSVKYDAFFERQGLEEALGVSEAELCTDLYGAKGNREGKRYWLSREEKNYQIVKSYDLCMRPQECNILHGIMGNSIFLYNTAVETVNQISIKNKNYLTVDYYYNLNARWKLLFDYFVMRIKHKLEKK